MSLLLLHLPLRHTCDFTSQALPLFSPSTLKKLWVAWLARLVLTMVQCPQVHVHCVTSGYYNLLLPTTVHGRGLTITTTPRTIFTFHSYLLALQHFFHSFSCRWSIESPSLQPHQSPEPQRVIVHHQFHHQGQHLNNQWLNESPAPTKYIYTRLKRPHSKVCITYS